MRLAVLQDREIFLLKAWDRVTLLILDEDRLNHQLRRGLNDCAAVGNQYPVQFLIGRRRRLRLRRRRNLLREGCQYANEKRGKNGSLSHVRNGTSLSY